MELDSVEEVAVAVLVATGAVCVTVVGAADLDVLVPCGAFEEDLGAVAGAGVFGAVAGVVAVGAPGVVPVGAPGVVGVAGAVLVGVPGGGVKTAAPALLGSAAASMVNKHRADLDTDAWVIEIERIVLWCPASIAPTTSAGKRSA